MKRILIFLTIVLCFSVAKADTLHVNATVGDAYLQNIGDPYATIQSDSCADYCYTAYDNAVIGQWLESGPNYYVRRYYGIFDASSLKANDVIDSVKFYCWGNWWDTTGGFFDLTIVNGYYDGTITTCDFKTGVWCGENDGGSINSSGRTWGAWFSIDLDSLQWINKDGTTYLALRSSLDISATSPTGQSDDRGVNIFTANKIDTIPYLKIWYYTTPSTVWVALPIDAEAGDTNFSVDSLNPIIYFDCWSEGGYAYPLFNPAWRDSFPDSEGGHPVWSWLFIYAEPFCSAANFSTVYEACTAVYDTMRNLWGSVSDSLGDETKAIHFHSFYWHSGLSSWESSALGSIDTTEFDTYMRIFLYEKKHFGASFRGGWNREDQGLSLFLEQWIPTDFTRYKQGAHGSWNNVPSYWYPYYPSDTNWQVSAEPYMDRTISRCNDSLASADIALAFDTAAASGKAILAYYHHNWEEMKDDFETHYERIKAKSDSMEIPFIFKTLTGAVAAYYGWTDTTDPTMNFVDTEDDSIRVRTSEVIFQTVPYGVTIDYSADPDTFKNVSFNAIDDTTWKYSSTVCPYRVIVAVTDTCGNVGIDSTGSEMAAEEGIARRFKIIKLGG